MRNRVIALLTGIAFLVVTGCATIPEEHKGAATGAGVGAATGAVLGAVVGGSTKSAVIGGLLGALVGGAVGHYYYDQNKTRTETANHYGYRSTQGPMIRIEGASVEPQTVAPGASRGDLVPRLAQVVFEDGENVLLVFDDQNACHPGLLAIGRL